MNIGYLGTPTASILEDGAVQPDGKRHPTAALDAVERPQGAGWRPSADDGLRALPAALVLTAFPPNPGVAGMVGPCVAASLAGLGWRVEGVSLAGQGGEAHLRLDFSTAVGIRTFEQEIAARATDVLVLDPTVLFFRRPRRLVHLAVAAIQIGFLWRLLGRARHTVLFRSGPRGFWPFRTIARVLLTIRCGTRLTPNAALDSIHAELVRALLVDAPSNIRAAPAFTAGDLAVLGPEASPPRSAALVVEAARAHGVSALCGVESLARGSCRGGEMSGPGQSIPAGVCARDPVAVGEAPDPKWSTGGVNVTRLMVHMRAALRAAPGLRPGSARAARRLVAWYEGAMRQVAGRGLPQFLETQFEAEASSSAIGRRIGAWWRDLSETGGLGSPLVAAKPPSKVDAEVLTSALTQVIRSLEAGEDCPPLPASAAAVLVAPVSQGEGSVSGLELALSLVSGALDVAPSSGAGWRSDIGRNLLAKLADPGSHLRRFATRAAGHESPDLTLIGFTRGGSGLAENLDMTRSVLRAAGLGCVTRSVELGLARVGDGDGSSARRGAPAPLRPARLIHVNADLIPQILMEPEMAAGRGTLSIGFLLWEFGVLPEAHMLALDMLDEVWCPTDFVADAYRATGRVPVHRVGKAVTLGDIEPVGRAGLGLPEGVFLFFVSFDFHSSVERKNPLAAVRAFRRAFPPARRDVGLVIKTTQVERGHWGDPNGQWGQILDLARHDSRIVILTGRMPRARYFALKRSVDCLVSPHRAEGFGYGPAQSMLLGVPVIATDWSGTRDFCTARTSFPVPARLVPVRCREAILPVDAGRWAEIDEDALVETMREVTTAPDDARARAAAGCALMKREYSVEAQAARYLERFRALGIISGNG